MSEGPILKDATYYTFWSVALLLGVYAVKLLHDIRSLLK